MSDITNSWDLNAPEWIALLERSGIPSRAVTNDAILSTVKRYARKHVIDLGCGEGWLSRALEQQGLHVTGLDATGALIEQARRQSEQSYIHISYEDIIAGKLNSDIQADTIVCNYALYEQDSTRQLLLSMRQFLSQEGKLIIQTVHPSFLLQTEEGYKSQWMSNAWEGLAGDFSHPHRWYARTLEDWQQLFHQAGYCIYEIVETLSAETKPLSIIFILA